MNLLKWTVGRMWLLIQRSAAYALRDLGSEAGFNALLQATNALNIGDIIYEVREKNRRAHSK